MQPITILNKESALKQKLLGILIASLIATSTVFSTLIGAGTPQSAPQQSYTPQPPAPFPEPIDEAKAKEYEIRELIKTLAEPYDLVETITVIAKIESNFGLYVVNINEGSCGITQIYINTFIARHNIKDTPFNRNKACSDLVNSYELSILNSIEELVYWKQQFCNKRTGKCNAGEYQKVIRAYNGGYKGYKGKQTKEYYEKFLKYHAELFPRPKKRIAVNNKR